MGQADKRKEREEEEGREGDLIRQKKGEGLKSAAKGQRREER